MTDYVVSFGIEKLENILQGLLSQDTVDINGVVCCLYRLLDERRIKIKAEHQPHVAYGHHRDNVLDIQKKLHEIISGMPDAKDNRNVRELEEYLSGAFSKIEQTRTEAYDRAGVKLN